MTEPKLPEPAVLVPAVDWAAAPVAAPPVEPEVEIVAPKPSPVISVAPPARQAIIIDRAAEAAIARAIRAAGG